MADISEININDIPYSIKDTQARNSILSLSTQYISLSTGGTVENSIYATNRAGLLTILETDTYSVPQEDISSGGVGSKTIDGRFNGLVRSIHTSTDDLVMEISSYRKNNEDISCKNVLNLIVSSTGENRIELDSNAWEKALGLNNYLPLSGGTVSGDITSEGTIRINKPLADISASSINANQYGIFGVTDVNNKFIGYIQGINYSNGMTAMQFTARKYVDNANVDNSLQLRVNASGTKTVSVSDSKIWRNALGASNGIWPIELGGTGNTQGQAATAVKLAQNRRLLTYLANKYNGSSDSSSYNGQWDLSGNTAIPVFGTLGIANGGTGQTDTDTDTFNRNTNNTTAGTITYYKWGKVVTVSAYDITLKAQLSANSGILIGSVTSGYRPSTTVVSYSGNSSHPGQVNIATGGGITFYNTSDTVIPKNTKIHFTVTYVIN